MIRRARNKVITIKDSNGEWVKGQERIQNTAKDYFPNLFKSNKPSQNKISSISDNVYLFLNEESKDFLNKEVSCDEIKRAIFQMGKNKAPSPNGFQARFFQEYWEMLVMMLLLRS